MRLFYRIFDHLDVLTIIRSLGRVCLQLYSTTNTYNRYELDFTLISKWDIKLIASRIRPENVISITLLGDDEDTSSLISLFYSRFDIRQFNRLRSLTLHKINSTVLDHFLQNVTAFFLMSLSIELLEGPSENTFAVLASAIDRFSLRRLYLRETSPDHRPSRPEQNFFLNFFS
jgi:hypothetical protein